MDWVLLLGELSRCVRKHDFEDMGHSQEHEEAGHMRDENRIHGLVGVTRHVIS